MQKYNILSYQGKPVTLYDYYHIYNKGDYVIFDGILFKSLRDLNVKHIPDLPTFSSFSYWEKVAIRIKEPKEENKPLKMIRGNHIGSISGDNVVIYGDNEGDISASGEKSVVVVFGDVTGSITADRVIRLDNTNTYPEWVQAVKAMTSKKQGDNYV